MTADAPRLADPELPAVGVLLGEDARHPLDALLERFDAEVVDFRRCQVTWWPGRSITVRFEVTTSNGASPHQIVACAGSIPAGAAIVESGDTQIGLWVLPHDPALPGLASALDPDQLRPMLSAVGLNTRRVASRLRAYRPGRRAVVQVDTEATRVFLKLGRPRSIAALHETHRLMAEVLPVPTSLGYDPELGLLLMLAGRGHTLRQALDEDRDLPSAVALEELVGKIPPPLAGSTARSPVARLSSLAELLLRIVPDQRGRLQAILGLIGADAGDEALVPVHGDLHDGQLLVDGERITGLLDVDTHGMGHPADDPARMLGHLASRAPHAPQPERVHRFATELAREWLARRDPEELIRRTAAVRLGLATGPFRVQEPDWPMLVRRRIAHAEQGLADENPLIVLSGRSHLRAAR